jgi:hypothetical protein
MTKNPPIKRRCPRCLCILRPHEKGCESCGIDVPGVSINIPGAEVKKTEEKVA